MSVAICAIAKNEQPQIEEWLDYHLKLVDHIVLQDNGPHEQVHLVDMPKQRGKLTRIPWTTFPFQMSAQNHFVKTERRFEFIGFLDIDEFLVGRNFSKSPATSFKAFLHEHCKRGVIGFNWRLFGSSGHVNKIDQPVLLRFQKCSKGLTDHVKIFGRRSDIQGMHDPHTAVLTRNCFSKNALGTLYNGHSSSSNLECPERMPWILHHQHTKSLEEQKEKISRGRANTHAKRSLQDFTNHDINEVFNDDAWKQSQSNY